ncbi:L-threonine dehydratase biosynthetic IlvA [Raoultella planticola]|uniref:L-threonine dehydratase biosynthetic IlvA n=1 Tax=Raoultella planticola TaxID=575 RepID=A0A485BHW0_RAOPL|nr:L-threonine dehydratase biosynthetic IlvA [Raoultella planticola]
MMAESQPLSAAPEGAEYLRAVLRAPVYEAAQITPLQKMEKISSRLDNVILVKREDRQPVHSFKLRGAYAMMAGLTEEQKSAGSDYRFCGQPRPGGCVLGIASWREGADRHAGCHGGHQSGCRT